VVAVCSSDLPEVEWAKNNDEYNEFGITVYANYDEMLAHPGLQAVWIATSTDVHASQSLAAMEKGLNVLCEKPFSTNLAEVRKTSHSYLIGYFQRSPSIAGSHVLYRHKR
jgi:myo-inositol 2-dehydrogenase/D-chiro-inositol 1-dehydrogenase